MILLSFLNSTPATASSVNSPLAARRRPPRKLHAFLVGLAALEEAGWPTAGPYAQFIQYWEYQIYLANQRNQDSEESDPNTGCIGDEVPEQ